MTTNPWLQLPEHPPYVLPEDEALVRAFNERAGPNRFLHVDALLPEAFVGAREAPVVLLSNNPGYTDEGAPARRSDDFMSKLRKNLRHDPLPYPFLFLNSSTAGA